jgi:hypothetical protein
MGRNTLTLQRGELACDYAAQVSLTWLVQNKYKASMRYIDGSVASGKPSWKCSSTAEMLRILDAGLGFGLIFERYSGRPVEGFAAGAVDGRLATADARKIGYPVSEWIMVAFDFDIGPSNLTACVAYWRGFQSTCAHPLGIYGDWDLLQVIGAEGVANSQPNARGWSFNWVTRLWKGTHPMAHMQQQRQANGIDPDVVTRPVQFWRGNTAPIPKPPNPTPTPPPVVVVPPVVVPPKPPVVPPNPPITPPVEAIDMLNIIVTGCDAQFLAIADAAGKFFQCEWTGPGSDPHVQARIKKCSRKVTIDLTALKDVTLIGDPGAIVDTKRTWSAADFFRVA